MKPTGKSLECQQGEANKAGKTESIAIGESQSRDFANRVLDAGSTPKTERDAVEAALAEALTKAAAAGRYDVVAKLARELEARRLARLERPADGNVVPLRRGKGGER